jgi:hypothetical protein
MFLLLWVIFFVAFLIILIINWNKKLYSVLNNNHFLYSLKKDYKTKIYLN